MASVSYSVDNKGGATLQFVDVTKGTSAPGAGSLEVRIDRTKLWTKNEVEIALDGIFRYILQDPSNSIGL